jgi:AcrR family transcriptional regulator
MSRETTTPSRPPTRRRLRQAERRAQTREKLVKAAGKVFARHGYERATLDGIADEAGLSKGALYYNFASKEELFLTLLEERLAERLGGVEGVFETGAPPLDQNREAAQRFLEGLERDPRWAPLFFEFLAYCARDPGRRAHFAERFLRAARRPLAQVIERRFESLGLDPPMPAEELALCVDALANGIVIERLFDPDAVADDLLGRGLWLLTRPLE